MEIKLISYTQPNKELMEKGIDDLVKLVAYCARVSNPGNQNNVETSEKLIHYLIKNQHWSPMECVSICLSITTTRDIARQILRHRSFSFQEFSQRYADPTKELNFVKRETRLQDKKNRQNSIDVDINDDEMRRVAYQWENIQDDLIKHAKDAYSWAISKGIAKEQARSVLPEGNTESRIYMNGTLRSWVHYIQLRSGNGTQKEHREIALACADKISPVFPMIHEFVSQ